MKVNKICKTYNADAIVLEHLIHSRIFWKTNSKNSQTKWQENSRNEEYFRNK